MADPIAGIDPRRTVVPNAAEAPLVGIDPSRAVPASTPVGIDPARSLDPAVTPEDAGVTGFQQSAGPLRKGLRSGFNNALASVEALAGQTLQSLGVKEYAATMLEDAKKNADFAMRVGPETRDYRQIKDLGTLSEFVLGHTGSGIASSVPAIAAGLALRRPVAGAIAGSYPQLAGEQVQKLRDDPKVSQDAILGNALGAAIPMAALETFGAPASAVARLLKPTAKGAVKSVGKDILKEGAVETAQDAIGQVAHMGLNPDVTLDPHSLINAGLAGAAGGGGIAAGSQVASLAPGATMDTARFLGKGVTALRERFGRKREPVDIDAEPDEVKNETTVDGIADGLKRAEERINAEARDLWSKIKVKDIGAYDKFKDAATGGLDPKKRDDFLRAVRKEYDDGRIKGTVDEAGTILGGVKKDIRDKINKPSLMNTKIDVAIADKLVEFIPIDTYARMSAADMKPIARAMRAIAEDQESTLATGIPRLLEKHFGGRKNFQQAVQAVADMLGVDSTVAQSTFRRAKTDEDKKLTTLQDTILANLPEEIVFDKDAREFMTSEFAGKMLDWVNTPSDPNTDREVIDQIRELFGDKADGVLEVLDRLRDKQTTNDSAFEADEEALSDTGDEEWFGDRRMNEYTDDIEKLRTTMKAMQAEYSRKDVQLYLEPEMDEDGNSLENGMFRIAARPPEETGLTDDEFQFIKSQGGREQAASTKTGDIQVLGDQRSSNTGKDQKGLRKISLVRLTNLMKLSEKAGENRDGPAYIADMFSRGVSKLINSKMANLGIQIDDRMVKVADADGNTIEGALKDFDFPDDTLVAVADGKRYTYGEIKKYLFPPGTEPRRKWNPETKEWEVREEPTAIGKIRAAGDTKEVSAYYDRRRETEAVGTQLDEWAQNMVAEDPTSIDEVVDTFFQLDRNIRALTRLKGDAMRLGFKVDKAKGEAKVKLERSASEYDAQIKDTIEQILEQLGELNLKVPEGYTPSAALLTQISKALEAAERESERLINAEPELGEPGGNIKVGLAEEKEISGKDSMRTADRPGPRNFEEDTFQPLREVPAAPKVPRGSSPPTARTTDGFFNAAFEKQAREILAQIQGVSEPFQKELDTVEARLRELQAEQKTLGGKRTTSAADRRSTDIALRSVAAEIRTLEGRWDTLRATLEDMQGPDLETEVKEATDKLKELRTKYAEATSEGEKQRLRAEGEALRASTDGLLENMQDELTFKQTRLQRVAGLERKSDPAIDFVRERAKEESEFLRTQLKVLRNDYAKATTPEAKATIAERAQNIKESINRILEEDAVMADLARRIKAEGDAAVAPDPRLAELRTELRKADTPEKRSAVLAKVAEIRPITSAQTPAMKEPAAKNLPEPIAQPKPQPVSKPRVEVVSKPNPKAGVIDEGFTTESQLPPDAVKPHEPGYGEYLKAMDAWASNPNKQAPKPKVEPSSPTGLKTPLAREDFVPMRELDRAEDDAPAIKSPKGWTVDEAKKLGKDVGEALFKALAAKKSAQDAASIFEMTSEEQDAIKAYVTKVLGSGAATKFGDWKHAGAFIQDSTGVETILVSMFALDPQSTAYHETMHAFFARLMEVDKKAAHTLLRAAGSPMVVSKLHTLLKDHPDAIKQLTAKGQMELNPKLTPAQAEREAAEERLAYMFQFWKASDDKHNILPLGPNTDTVFGTIQSWFRKIAAVWSDNMGDALAQERANELFSAFDRGEFANRNTVAQVLREKYPGVPFDKVDKMFPGLGRIMGKFVWTATGAVRDLNVPELTRIMDMFHTAQGARNQGPGFLQAKHEEYYRRMNVVNKALEGMDAAQQKTVLDELRSGKAPTSAAAKTIRGVLDEAFEYMKEAGVAVPEKNADGSFGYRVISKVNDNYFPRVYDKDKLLEHRKEFIALLEANKVENPELVFEQLVSRKEHQLPEEDQVIGLTFYTPALNRRTLLTVPEAELSKYMADDLMGIMSEYLARATRRAEYTRRFDNAGEVIAEARKEAKDKHSLTPDQLKTFDEAVKAMEGSLGNDMSESAQRLYTGLMTYQNVRLLPLALFSSLIDPLGIMVRGGGIADATRGFWMGITGLIKTHKGEAAQLAETIGAINAAHDAHEMADLYGSQYMPKGARRINDTFFRWNGMESWNKNMRIAASVAAKKFIERHATDPNEHSTRYLEELNLTKADVDIKNGELVINDKVRQAMNMWVDGAILRPNAALRPVYMSDPNWMLISHLKQYTYLFQKQIIGRVSNELEHGNYTPAFTLLSYVPTIIAADMLKAALTPGGADDDAMARRTAADWMWHGVQRAGIFGPSQYMLDTVGDGKHNSYIGESLAGPTVQQLLSFVRGAAKGDITEELVRAIPGERLIRN